AVSGRVECRLPAGLAEAHELEIVLLARHAGHDAADARPAAEAVADAGDDRRLPAGRVAEAEGRQHREQNAAALGKGAGSAWMRPPGRRTLRRATLGHTA